MIHEPSSGSFVSSSASPQPGILAGAAALAEAAAAGALEEAAAAMDATGAASAAAAAADDEEEASEAIGSAGCDSTGYPGNGRKQRDHGWQCEH